MLKLIMNINPQVKHVACKTWGWIKQTLYFFYQYSGVRLIVSKFTVADKNDPNYKQPPVGPIWLAGIYVASFGVANQLYLDAVANNISLIDEYNSVEVENVDDCVEEISQVLRSFTLMPVKPYIYSPRSVFETLFGDVVPSLASTEAYSYWSNGVSGLEPPRFRYPDEMDSEYGDMPPIVITYNDVSLYHYFRIYKSGSVSLRVSPNQISIVKAVAIGRESKGHIMAQVYSDDGVPEALTIHFDGRNSAPGDSKKDIEAVYMNNCPFRKIFEQPRVSTDYEWRFDCSVLLLASHCANRYENILTN